MAGHLLLRHSRDSRNPCSLGARPRPRLDPRFRRDEKGSNGQDGFTLVELMVVIVIIGLLATVVVINVMPASDRAAVTKARADIATLEQGAEMYRLTNMRYPSAQEGLQALVTGNHIRNLPNDPWGNPYRYAAPGRQGRQFEIISYGADGREGGEGNDADISGAGS